jgi:hypothetical protein
MRFEPDAQGTRDRVITCYKSTADPFAQDSDSSTTTS